MQSRRHSLLESCLNVGSGFVISLIVWRWVIAPAYGFDVGMKGNLEITGMFTVVSVVRGYIWRRLFNGFFSLTNPVN